MLSPEEFERCAQLLKALADPQRLKVLSLLFDGPSHVGRIAEALNDVMPRVSYHLAVLREAGLVTATKVGRFVEYALHPDAYAPAADAAAERVVKIGSLRLAFPPHDATGRPTAR